MDERVCHFTCMQGITICVCYWVGMYVAIKDKSRVCWGLQLERSFNVNFVLMYQEGSKGYYLRISIYFITLAKVDHNGIKFIDFSNVCFNHMCL